VSRQFSQQRGGWATLIRRVFVWANWLALLPGFSFAISGFVQAYELIGVNDVGQRF
jgi:hypothetical protein